LKNILLVFLTTLFLIGCNGNQPTPKNNNVKNVKEEYEKTISYQDIIMKINDINTNKKTNKRVQNIVKEYQYNVSDDDSKNSARKKALTQVKILILEEIGVFVESYLELSTVVENDNYREYFKEEIKNLTAGIVKTKIIDERFDGKTYYVKASVLVDPDSVSEGISEILKIKANKSEITKLNKLLKSKEQEIDMRSSETISLQKKITNQELLNKAKAKELKITQTKLKKAKAKLKTYQIEETILNKELQKTSILIEKTMKKVNLLSAKACLIKIGMPRVYVEKILGNEPRNGFSPYAMYYGKTILHLNDGGVVSQKEGCNSNE